MKLIPHIPKVLAGLTILLSITTVVSLTKAQTSLQKIQSLEKIIKRETSPQIQTTNQEQYYDGTLSPSTISGTGEQLMEELSLTKQKHREICTSYRFHIAIAPFSKEWRCEYAKYKNEKVVEFTISHVTQSSVMTPIDATKQGNTSNEYPGYAVSNITVHIESISIQSKKDGGDPILTELSYAKTKGKKREYVLSGGENVIEAITFISGSSHCEKNKKNCWDYLNPDYKVSISIQKWNPEFPDEKIIMLLEKVVDSIQPLDEWAIAKLSE